MTERRATGTVTSPRTDIGGSKRRWVENVVVMQGAIERHGAMLIEAVLVAGATIFKYSVERLLASFPLVHSVSASVVRSQAVLAAHNEVVGAFMVVKVVSVLRAAT